MSADHFTEPLQGSLFKNVQAETMNLPEGLDNFAIVQEVYKSENNDMIKLYHVNDNPISQEFSVEY